MNKQMCSIAFCLVLFLSVSLVQSQFTYTYIQTHYNAPACEALISDTITAEFTIINATHVSVDVSDEVRTIFSNEIAEFGAGYILPRLLTTTATLDNGETVPTILMGTSTDESDTVSRADIFINTASFRSQNPSNADFTEYPVCHLTYFANTNIPVRSAPEPRKPRHANANGICEFDETIVSYDDAVECVRSVSFSDDIRDRTLDTLDIMANMYVYRDININSGGDDPVSVDLVKELEDLRDKNYNRDYDFHADLHDLFISGRDVHTQYSGPLCYKQITFFQPFSIYSTIDDRSGDQVLTVGIFGNANSEELYDFLPSAYDNFIIDEINEQDALDYLIDWVDDNVPDKQQSNRFNSALGFGFTPFHVRSGRIPEDETIVWTLRNPVTNDVIKLSVPWLANVPTGITEEIFEEQCRDSFADLCGSKKRSIVENEKKTHPINRRNLEGFDVLTDFGPAALYAVDERTGVITVSAFTSQLSPVWLTQALTVLYLESIHRYHFDKLIIDVSSNGGGVIFVGQALAALLDTHEDDINDFSNFDQIHSDFWDEAIDVYFNDFDGDDKDSFADVGLTDIFERVLAGDDELPDPEESWYNPGNSYSRGGETSQYSEKVELFFFDGEEYSDYIDFITGSFVYESYAQSNILILTNGLCYSTCSFFIRSLQSSSSPIRTVGYGGIVDEPLRSSDVPANVYSISLIKYIGDEFQSLGYDQFEELTPDLFPFVETCFTSDGSAFQVALFESYAETGNTNTPEEFVYSRVDVRLNIWPKDSQEAWYLTRAEFYDNPQSTYGSDPILSISSPILSSVIPTNPLSGLLSSSATMISFSFISLLISFLFLLF